MDRKMLGQAILPASGILILILDSKCALQGAIAGVELCITALIPSLFPFIFLSILLSSAILGSENPFFRWVGRFCRLDKGTEPLLAVGILGGYPVGAQNIGLFYRAGVLGKKQSERMLAFCSNAGPAFFFGIIGPMFDNILYVWLLWGIHIAGALLVGHLSPCVPCDCIHLKASRIRTSDALTQALKAMATICGWVILFRILLHFLEKWVFWLFPVSVQVTIAGILELANGCVQLRQIPTETLRFLMASILLALGGVCVTMQTVTVTEGLSIRPYLAGKALQTLFCGLMTDMIRKIVMPMQEYHIPFWCDAAILVIIVSVLQERIRRKKRSSIPSVVGV